LTLDSQAGKIERVDHPAKDHAMKKLLVAAVLSGASISLGASPALAADIPALYQKHCGACHGASGQGGTATPPIAGMPAASVVKVVNNHPPPMDKTGMTVDEVAAMGRYVSGMKK
jgi:mono/diheme cytochrome c family protein